MKNNAQHVHADAGDEHEGGPVMDLADEEAAAQVERDVQRRFHRRGHRDAAHGLVRTVVVRFDHGCLEEERQEGAGQQHDDEAPQGDLAEHERPVVGEDLAAELFDDARHAGALVEIVRRGADEAAAERLAVTPRGRLRRTRIDGRFGRDVLGGVSTGTHERSQKLGPTGSWKSLCATR
ncbi:hypothetical protein QE410_002023 [Microbacterium sp. SORGH_AS 1204]|nr:hypothetical protein [Microbacterium sp. SORGH_AS_1204]